MASKAKPKPKGKTKGKRMPPWMAEDDESGVKSASTSKRKPKRKCT